MALDFLVEEGLTDFQRSLQRALSNLPHRPSDIADVARLRSGLREVLALLNYHNADTPVRGLEGALAQDIDARVVASRNGFDVIHLHLPRLRASVARPAVERVTRDQNHPQCLVVATSADPADEGAWHFINVKDAGQGRRVLRRAVLEPPFVGRTVLETLSQCQVRNDEVALDIQIAHERAFDVEVVSKRFYIEYAQQFEQLRDELQTVHGVAREKADGAVQELLNRLIFLMFIQRKSWLPTPENPDRNFLWTEFVHSHRADPAVHSYHSEFLHPLFVALSRRKEPHARRGLPAEVKQVPFLNGGLFDLDDDTEVYTLPNSAFERLFKSLLLRYNFTIREDTPLEVEVAIDPEMLGRVFENLILQLEKTGDIDPRKATGSYYTPRPIVHFMCQQALKEWIAGQDILEATSLDRLFALLQGERMGPEERGQLGEMISEGDAERLRERLLGISVVDPAVGSGAFLVGMLHEILAMVRLLDLLLVGSDEIDRRNYDYERKRDIIERCLYGVDIQRRAVRICELRLWLSLVVDYELAAGEAPPALPNLTYRVVAGDSLVEHLLGHEVRWMGEPANDRERQLVDTIQAEKDAHFFKDDPHEKHQLEVSIIRHTAQLAREILSRRDRETQIELGMTVSVTGPDPLLAEIDGLTEKADRLAGRGAIRAEDVAGLRRDMRQTFVWRLDFAEVFRRKRGFDIAIANPPYVRQQTITSMKPSLRRAFPATYDGVADIYVYFYDRSLSILRPGGILCFISSNKYFRSRYGEKLRELLAERSTLKTIIDFGDLPVFDATTYPTVLLAWRALPQPEGRVQVLRMETLDALDMLAETVERNHFNLPQVMLRREGWLLEDGRVYSLLQAVRDRGASLRQSGYRMYRGVTTGLNNAFVVDGALRTRLLEDDPHSADLIKPFVRGRDIDRWRIAHKDLWLIFTRRGTDIERYPAIRRHLAAFRDKLEPGVIGGRKPGDYEWYEIQDTTAYYDEFSRPKIMFPDIAAIPEFAYDRSGLYCGNTVYILPAPSWLAAVLNSSVAEFFHRTVTATFRGGFLRFIAQYVEAIPVPALTQQQIARLETLVDRLCAGVGTENDENEVDSMVCEAFGLTTSEVSFLREWLAVQRRSSISSLLGVMKGRGRHYEQDNLE